MVHFYADNGRFEPGDSMPSFTARDVEYDGKVLKGEAQPPRPNAKSATPARDKATADLAEGIALMGGFNFADARPGAEPGRDQRRAGAEHAGARASTGAAR